MTVILDDPNLTVTATNAAPKPRRLNVCAAETRLGEHQVRSAYVEEHWLSYLGPTAYLLARHLDSLLATHPKAAIEVERTAEALGVGPDKVTASVDRLVRYGLATWSPRDALLALVRHWPEVPAAIRTPRHRAALVRIPDSETP